MSTLNKDVILRSLIKHETLSIDDISKEANLGMAPNVHHLKSLLIDLKSNGHIDILNDVKPVTYTITQKGIEEGVRLESKATAGQNF